MKTTMVVACFHVLSNPGIHRRLRQELMDAFPDPTMEPTLPELEQLPYLTAVIQECEDQFSIVILHLNHTPYKSPRVKTILNDSASLAHLSLPNFVHRDSIAFDETVSHK